MSKLFSAKFHLMTILADKSNSNSPFNQLQNRVKIMTPAIKMLKNHKISHQTHEYQHDSDHQSYGHEAIEKLNVAEQKVFKTLIVNTNNNQLLVAIIPVTSRLNMKSLAKAAGFKKVEMAAPNIVERSTGYVLGGVSPLGQKKRLKTFIATDAKDLETIYVSGGRRGLEIELAIDDLQKLVAGVFADICQA